MFKDLLKNERQKLWLTSGLSATETHPYEQALASRVKTYAEDFGDERINSDIGERRGWPASHDVLAIARMACGL
jgi:hypothetical protein